MSQAHTILPETDAEPKAGELRVIDLLIAFAKHKRLLVILPLVSVLFAAAISFVLPSVYQANTRLLPPQSPQSGAAALLSQLGGMAGAAAGIAGIKNSSDLYIGMLKSRTVADELIKKFDLKRAYDTDSQERARQMLQERTNIVTGKDGLIVVTVDDKRRDVVAALTNGYVDELIKLTRRMAVTEAGQRRVFFEQQLELAKNNLANAEVELKRSLETRGVVSVEGDSRAIIGTVAKLRAQISAKEVELNSMSAFVTKDNPQYQRIEAELASARQELHKIENGREDKVGTAGGDNAGSSGMVAVKLLREVKYHQMLYELLAKQYEVARLDEAKDPSIIQVLDRAFTPEKRHSPVRSVIVLGAGAGGLVLALFLAVLLETRRKVMQVPGNLAEWEQFKSHLYRK